NIVSNQDFFGQFVIGRRNKEHLTIVAELADDGCSGSLLDTRDPAFGPAARFAQSDFHFDPIAIHGGTDQSSRYINVTVDPSNFFSRNHKSISITMDKNRAFDQVSRRSLVPAATVFGDLPLFDQLIQNVLDLLACSRRRSEIFKNPPEIRTTVGGL